MIFGKKKRVKNVEITPAYMPVIMGQLQGKKFDDAMEILGNAARDYFGRISEATETINGEDAAIVIKLFRHMADELERADPQAAKIVKAMEKIELPPIEYRRQKN